MSLNLTIAVTTPFDWRLAYSRLALRTNLSEILEPIVKAGQRIGGTVSWYGDEGIEEAKTVPYEERPLTDIESGLLADMLSQHFDKLNGFDRAVVRFLQALPAGSRVLLWWH